MMSDDIDPVEDLTDTNENFMDTTQGPPVIEEVRAEEQRSKFDRGLSPDFIGGLTAWARKDSLWADVLADSDLFVAVRGAYLNVYYLGQSLFLIAYRDKKFTVTTHPKFLLDPDLEKQIPLSENGEFEISDLKQIGFIPRYQSASAGETLKKLKRAAKRFAGPEKTGCHKIAVNKKNHAIIDCEIQFPYVGPDGARVDMACLEPHGENEARLVFWEAKHYKNRELLIPNNGHPEVYSQVDRYKKYITHYRKDIVESYEKVIKNLFSIKEMGAQRELAQVILDVESGKRKLVLDKDKPEVGLVIFGYDAAQRDHGNIIKPLRALQVQNHKFSRIIANGSASGVVLKTEAL